MPLITTKKSYYEGENWSPQQKERVNILATPSSVAAPFTMFVPRELNFLWRQLFRPHLAPDPSVINVQTSQKFRGCPGARNIVQTGVVMAQQTLALFENLTMIFTWREFSS